MVVLLGFGCKFPAKLIHLNMKHLTLLAGLALCTTAAFAQQTVQFEKAMKPDARDRGGSECLPQSRRDGA